MSGIGSVRGNYNQATTGHMGMQLLQGAAGTIPYLIIPTLLNLEGPIGLLVGSASTWILGVLLGWPGMQIAAAVLPVTHMWYGYLQEPVVKPIFNRYLWRLNPGAVVAGTNAVPSTDNSTVGRLANRMGAGVGYYPSEMNDAILPGGVQAPAYNNMLNGFDTNPTWNFASGQQSGRYRMNGAPQSGNLLRR